MSIKAVDLNYVYGNGTAFEQHALFDVNFEIQDGEFVGIIGHTGSGKSTLIQHLNGLIKASSGALYYNGENIYEDKYDMKKLRSKVGLVFQYPEHQLFEIDVLTDVCFGPKNQGFSEEEAKEKAKKALSLVGLGESYYSQSPFELSGGQKRRVAIAGVLAMEPEVLILDEPTAGLDPNERIAMRNLIAKEALDRIVILATHIISDVECVADEIVLMKKGQLVGCKTPEVWLDDVKPYVREFVCKPGEIEKIQEDYVVSNMRQCQEGISIRVIGEKFDGNIFKLAETLPTLDDVYLYFASV